MLRIHHDTHFKLFLSAIRTFRVVIYFAITLVQGLTNTDHILLNEGLIILDHLCDQLLDTVSVDTLPVLGIALLFYLLVTDCRVSGEGRKRGGGTEEKAPPTRAREDQRNEVLSLYRQYAVLYC